MRTNATGYHIGREAKRSRRSPFQLLRSELQGRRAHKQLWRRSPSQAHPLKA